jgi:hypothetical protein
MSIEYYSPIGFLDLNPNINILQLNSLYSLNQKFIFNESFLQNDKTNIVIMNNHPASVEFFRKNILPNIKYKFIIISFCCDTTFPTESNGWSLNEQIERGNNYETIINNEYLIHWFATNKITPNDEKTTGIPYGLDYWVLNYREHWQCPMRTDKEQDNILCNINNQSFHFTKRIPKIYANFHLSLTDTRHGNNRRQLQNIIPQNIIYYANQLPRDFYWYECSKYAFVLSPHGNGLDCIRTWEALSLGCIVIVKKSSIDYLYDELPVLIVDNWSDITEKLLYETLEKMSQIVFNMEKIKMKYWINKVNEKLSI